MSKNLLTLHQIFTVTYRKLSPLLMQDPQLMHFATMSPTQLAQLLTITAANAQKLQQQFLRYEERDIEAFYVQHQIFPIFYGDVDYPQSLYDMYDPPAVLYAKGNRALLATNKIAMIGSRQATSYSQQIIQWLMPQCKQQNLTIVSGLARGADTMAHTAAVAHQCPTIAVLGHGFQYMYPPEHATLAEHLGQQHLLLTEYPYHCAPQRWHFPMRNRIISGLSEAIIVTEAAKKSGTMSTVEYALEHGKDIYAVPGNIFSPLSEGPNALIAEGATPLTTLENTSFLQHFNEKN